jgi:hypothetical protein
VNQNLSQKSYSASGISKIIGIAPKNVRNQISKLQLSVHTTNIVSGNGTAFYLFTALPREWQSKINEYERQQRFDAWLKENEEACRLDEEAELRQGRSFTPAQQEILKQHEIDTVEGCMCSSAAASYGLPGAQPEKPRPMSR